MSWKRHVWSAVFLVATSAQAVFVDQSGSLGIVLGGNDGPNAAWGDYNNDGYSDVLNHDTVWVNSNGTNFTGVGGVGGQAGLWADYDNDGYLDIYTWYLSGALYRNINATGFGSVPVDPLPKDTSGQHVNRCLGGAWGDFDGDGYIDIYVGGNEIFSPPADFPDCILRNTGGTGLVTNWVQSSPVYRAVGVTACDFDEDGDIDVYVSNYRLQPNLLWRNNGSGVFTDEAAAYGAVGGNGNTIGSAWGDLDNDGHFDLFVGNFSHAGQPAAQFLRNLGPAGSWHFSLENELSGADWQESYASPALGDYDNDGDLDLYFTTIYGGDNARLYRNDGNWSFTDVTGPEGLGGMPSTSQAAWADFDNDGDLDLATGGRLYVNQGNGNHWLKVHLEGNGTTINRAAIGAQVRIDLGGGVILTRQVEAGTGSGNQNDLTLHFGLGSRATPVDLEIFWPNGETRTVSNVAVDGIATFSAGPKVNNSGGATNVTHDTATLQGYLVDTGGAATAVSVYWGTTNAGESGWDTNMTVGPRDAGPLSQTVAGLAPNTHYYYRFYATNGVMGAWASPSAEFITAGTVPFSETFDTLTPGDIHGQHGWKVAGLDGEGFGAALIQGDQTYTGSAGACSVSNADVAHAFSGAGADANVLWADMYVIPETARSVDAVLSNPNAKAIFFVDEETGALGAVDGETPVVFTNRPAVPEGEWVRFTTRMDYGSKTWDVWVNSTTVVYNLAFHATNTPGFARLRIRDRPGAQASYVDNVAVSPDRPAHILLLDSDGDALDDDWERKHFTSLGISGGGPEDDWDGDRFPDIFEFLANTDPTDTNSLLIISHAWPEAADELVLEWQSASSRTYAIERSTDLLVGDWAAVISNLPAVPPLNRYTITVSESDSFYRIMLDD